MKIVVGNRYINKTGSSAVVDRIYVLSKFGSNLGQIKNTDEFKSTNTGETIRVCYYKDNIYEYNTLRKFEDNFLDLESIREYKINELLK